MRTDLFPNLEKGPGLNTLKEMARMADLSPASLAKVKTIKAKAVPAVIDAVCKDEIAIDVAVNLASLPLQEQNKLAAEGVQAMKAAAKAKRDAKKARLATAKFPIPESSQEVHNTPVAGMTDGDKKSALSTARSQAMQVPAQAQAGAEPIPIPECAIVTASVNAHYLPKVQTQEEDCRRLSEDLQAQLNQCRKEHDLVLKENAALRSENQALQLKLEALRLQLQAPQKEVACAAA